MLKKAGLFAMTLFGVAAMVPVTAFAQDGYYYGRPQPYYNNYNNDRDWDRHARHEWREHQREERREERWRDREWRNREWREHERYENRWNGRYPDAYYNNYYGYPR
jgi:hypothetical protein